MQTDDNHFHKYHNIDETIEFFKYNIIISRSDITPQISTGLDQVTLENNKTVEIYL